MKRVILVLALLVIAACGKSPTAPPRVDTGTLFFTLDARSCPGVHVVTFFVSNKEVGTETMFGGQTSQGYVVPLIIERYPLPAGYLTVQARVGQYRDGNALWTTRDGVRLEPGGSVTHLFVC